MKSFEQWISNLNSRQKLIIAIAFPLLLLVITLPIAESVYYNSSGRWFHGHYFGFDKNWWVWLIYLTTVAFIEYKLFDTVKKQL